MKPGICRKISLYLLWLNKDITHSTSSTDDYGGWLKDEFTKEAVAKCVSF
ncbi:MAG: hypothetical protein Q4F84_00495 [Fibrobacter sp.]|nr:hypothetical protein [Fibrobacter sp.]